MAAALGALLSVATLAASGASLPACDSGATKYRPCELHFEWNAGELAPGKSPYRDEILNVEFRGPDQTTYLIRPFWDGGRILRVRFTPNLSGRWAYRVTSEIKRFQVPEATFSVADNTNRGFISVANVRHWWTDDKQPHLWASIELPPLTTAGAEVQSFLDTRKQEGYTHVRTVLLTNGDGGPLDTNGQPNLPYFTKLDDRLLYANDQGFVLDLILADLNFSQSGVLDKWDTREALVRYLISRYAPLNVTWQGIEHFEDRATNREALKQIAALLKKYDSFHHPQSTDAHMTSSLIFHDDWENYILEGSADPQLAAVEHQFTAAPQIHVIQSSEPDAFRRELWSATTNGEYPTVRYEAARNPANIEAMKVWLRVMSDVRHWEFEPYFDVDGATAAGLDNVEYLLYAPKSGTVEISFSEKHKYNPRWINPRTGETIDLKDVKQDTYTENTPGSGSDWILQVPREGRKEGMLKSYKFESEPPPLQEVELNPASTPFAIVEPAEAILDSTKPVPFKIKLTRANRATRVMQYMWIGEVVAEGSTPRVLALGSSGTFEFPPNFTTKYPAVLNLRLNGINANGKAYSIEKVYQISK